MASTVSVGLIGSGLVGGTLLDQLAAQHAQLGDADVVRVAGILELERMLLVDKTKTDWCGEIANWKNGGGTKADMNSFIEHMAAQPGAILVDCTSSDFVANKYPEWMEKGLNVVTPNKKGFSGDLGLFKQIMDIHRSKKALVFHECTVGAGLPVLSTLRGLLRTGDEVVRIEGIFSGTMSYLFNSFSSTKGPSEMPFSACVARAKELGYTEPDARDDLNGMDVVRKVIILGRVAGIDLTVDALNIQNIVPDPLQKLASAAAFMDQLPQFDDHFNKLNAEAAARGEVLRYVGVVDGMNGSAAELRSYPYSHPFASLTGSDNIIAFHTKRYPNPLIVQGAGAGAAVTAGGIFNDILEIADRIL